ncbi:hypothetical protein JCM12178A_05390 [Salidesulfovibrio brasiliensis]
MQNSWNTEGEKVFLLRCLELLAAVFRGPDAGTCAGMLSQGIPSLVAGCPEAARSILEPLTGMQAMLPEDHESFCDDLSVQHVRLFVTAQGGVPVPLYESCHVGASRQVMGPEARAMAERFRLAGVEPAGSEPPDHLPLEIEYLYMLLARGWDGADAAALQEAALFAGEVMLPWCASVESAIAEHAPGGFFHKSATLLNAVLAAVSKI